MSSEADASYGMFSDEISLGSLSLLAYILNTEKSQVCLGQTQLSVSPPNFPIELGGAPTNLTSLKVLEVII